MKFAQFESIAEKVRNWGRWGAEDQRGTLNHIGAETLRGAAAAARQGKLFSLGLRFDKDGPQMGGMRFNPMLYMKTLGTPFNPERPELGAYTDDVIHMPLQAATQWDAFAHVHYEGQMYNGFKVCDHLSTEGAARCGIEHLASPGIMSRGVLLDIARLKGVEMLPVDYAITADDLNAALARQNVVLRKGDVALIRTGFIRTFTVHKDRPTLNGPQPGLSAACAEWVHDHSLAAVAADNLAVEILSAETMGGDRPLPLHMLMLRDMGCPLGEIFDMEALAEDCAADGQYDFLFTAPPLAVTGAVGSPINPLALK